MRQASFLMDATPFLSGSILRSPLAAYCTSAASRQGKRPFLLWPSGRWIKIHDGLRTGSRNLRAQIRPSGRFVARVAILEQHLVLHGKLLAVLHVDDGLEL